MALYRFFVIAFTLSLVALVGFIFQYVQFFSQLMAHGAFSGEANPEYIFRMFFTPVFIINAIILGIASLTYKIIGIVFVAQRKDLPGGEQALWILGFIFMGFVTAIVFMAMNSSRQWAKGQSHDAIGAG